jgi:hypothetical protein
MKSKSSLFALALALASSTALAQSSPPPGSVSLGALNYAGPGCPDGSLAVSLSPDGSAFTILYSSLVAATGPGVDASQSVSGCQLSLSLAGPPGWAWAVDSIDFRGYVKLDPHVLAQEKDDYHFADGRHVNSAMDVFHGPLDEDYVDHVAPHGNSGAPYSACGGSPITISTEARITGRGNHGAAALLTVDSADGVVAHQLNLSWRTCP